jgi:hypothetical protein
MIANAEPKNNRWTSCALAHGQVASFPTGVRMKNRKACQAAALLPIAAAALLAVSASGGAHAIVVTTSNGAATTYTENFEGTRSGTGGTLIDAGNDDYLLLSALSPTASYTFTTGALASLQLSFWYSGPGGNNGQVDLTGSLPGSPSLHSTLGNTPGSALQYLGNNPGAATGGSGAFDSQFNATLYNLGAGTYTLSFARGPGRFNSLKLDDIAVTVTPVPEPNTYALMLGGLGAVAWVARRRRPGRD